MLGNDDRKAIRQLPSVDAVLRVSAAQAPTDEFGHEETAVAIRAILAGHRADILKGAATGITDLSPDAVAASARQYLLDRNQPALRRVINATGIILHTGLGRAWMPECARQALAGITGYCNLQQDLATGRREHREDCLRQLVHDITGAEDVLVVNNNAAATLLMLAALARGREVAISRGELIEIGGSFRLPDIMQESGAILREVGTTNKTHLCDYESAMGPRTGLLLKVHKSNYKMVGFTQEIHVGEIVGVGRAHGIPVADDLGCGALVGLEAFGLPHEGTVQESLAAGADLVLFSTDKLIGGPQGGMIVGRSELIARIRSHPLYRAFRVCKLTLAALEATLRLFKAPDRLAQSHPLYAMIGKTRPEMETQAVDLAQAIRARHADWTVDVLPERSFLGGGALPDEALPSFAVAIRSTAIPPAEMALRLRTAAIPVVGRVHDGRLLLDVRTVFPSEHADLLASVESLDPHPPPDNPA